MSARGPKSVTPVFHIPVGRTRDQDGEVVPFKGAAGGPDQASAMEAWHFVVTEHPATLAAGACVIIGPNVTRYVDIVARRVTESRSPKGAWEPGAMTDEPSIKRGAQP